MTRHFWNRRTTALSCAALLTFVLGACGSSDDGATTSTSDAPPIVIGAVLNLTGAGSTLGEASREGLELEADRINEAGGIEGVPIKLVIEDDKSDPNEAVSVVREMIRAEKPIAIIGPNIVAGCYATQPITEAAKVVQYCQSGAPVPEKHPFYFSAISPFFPWLGGMPVHWANEQGYKNIALLSSNDTTGQLSRDVIGAVAEEGGLNVSASEIFPVDAVDITSQATKIMSSNPDVVVLGVSGRPAVVALQGLQQVGLDVPVWTLGANSSYLFADLVKGILPSKGLFTNGEAVVVPDDVSEDYPTRENAVEWAQVYEERFSKKAGIFDAAAADALRVLAKAIGKDRRQGEELVAEMHDMDLHVGILYTYDFTPEDHRGTNLSGIVIRFNAEGEFDFVEQYDSLPDYVTQAGQK